MKELFTFFSCTEFLLSLVTFLAARTDNIFKINTLFTGITVFWLCRHVGSSKNKHIVAFIVLFTWTWFKLLSTIKFSSKRMCILVSVTHLFNFQLFLKLLLQQFSFQLFNFFQFLIVSSSIITACLSVFFLFFLRWHLTLTWPGCLMISTDATLNILFSYSLGPSMSCLMVEAIFL